ncbi:unnamed protein product [Clavelina lepadiformis]|uniref:Pentraxin family member n=1 Tax=Clavelina lepadiformis TaxID=159417 RepID=A0ABP0F7H2_CLALP
MAHRMVTLVCLFTLGVAVTKGCSVNQFYFPNAKQTSNFVRYRSYFPQMFKAGTACLWVNPQTTSGFIPLASYAIGSQNNEWIIGIDNGKVSLYIHGPHTLFPVTVSINIWTHLCVWFDTSSHQVGVFKNGEDVDRATYNGEYVRGGGALVLGQEQDSVGGSFDSNQSFGGYIRSFMVWPRKLSSYEMNNIAQNCNCPVDTSVEMNMDRAEIYGAVSYEVSTCRTV